MGPRAGHLLLEDARAARVGQVFDLGGQVLVGGGNAGVTESMLHGSVSMGHKYTLRNPLVEPTERSFQWRMAKPARWLSKVHLSEPAFYSCAELT